MKAFRPQSSYIHKVKRERRMNRQTVNLFALIHYHNSGHKNNFNSNKCDSPGQRVLFSSPELVTVTSRNPYYHMGIQPDIPVVGEYIFTNIDL